MKKTTLFIFLLVLVTPVLHGSTDCPTTVPGDNPVIDAPGDYREVFVSGNFATPSQTDNVFIKFSVDYLTGVSCTDPAANDGPFPRRYCTIDPDGRTRVVYSETQLISCPVGYALGNGVCQLIGACPATEPPPPILCDDGFPADAGLPLGLGETCDRPALQSCADGSIVRGDVGICSAPCFDYGSCEVYALTQSECGIDSYPDFQYTDPLNWTLTCQLPDPDSPDSLAQGGNADGNIFNDPSSPITTPVADLDPKSVGDTLADSVQPALSAIESAVRDSTDQSKTNTLTLESAIDDLLDSNTTALAQNTDAVETGNAALERIADAMPVGSSVLPEHIVVSTFADANQNFYNRVQTAPLIASFSGISSPFSGAGVCPSLDIDLTAAWGQSISNSVHCDLLETISPVISALAIIFYGVVGFRIVASA